MSKPPVVVQVGDQTGIVGKLKIRMYPKVCRYFSRAKLVEGKLRSTDEMFRCLFVENTPLTKYIIPRMYEDPPVKVRESWIWIPFLTTILKAYSNRIDMCVAVLPPGYDPDLKNQVKFKSHMLVRSFIDTSGGLDMVKKQFRDNKRRFYNRMDRDPVFSCRISQDIKDFDLFYSRMHLPHVLKRFQEFADLDPYEHMKNSFMKGFLLMIEDNSKAVAGVLCKIENDTLFFMRTGVLDGDDEYVKKGASSAQYYFALKYALENGISKVELMRSRPFFDDGVYVTKRKWGAEVYPDNEPWASVFFFIPEISRKVAKFFENNPMIIHKENKLYGLIGWSGAGILSAKDEENMCAKYYSPGLNGFIVIKPGPGNPARFIGSTTHAPVTRGVKPGF